MFLVEYCIFFSINFGYISDPLHDVNNFQHLLGVEEWSTEVVCGALSGLAIKPPEHFDVVLVFLLVALGNFHTYLIR